MTSTTVRELQGKFYTINGNQPILLDDPRDVWVVQSGSVALFAVTVNKGVVEGTRRYLFSTGLGEALSEQLPVLVTNTARLWQCRLGRHNC